MTVALKNGWKYLPTCARQDESCPWQVNSIGWVRGKGRNYVLAVLTTDDPAGPGTAGLDYGITTVEEADVGRATGPSPRPRPASGSGTAIGGEHLGPPNRVTCTTCAMTAG